MSETTKTTRGAPAGNDNNKKPRIFSDAIRKHLIQNPKKLSRMIEVACDKAMDGDMLAFRELIDRMEGKPTQSIDADVQMDIVVEIVRFGDDQD